LELQAAHEQRPHLLDARRRGRVQLREKGRLDGR
jgi:hypothetical protein